MILGTYANLSAMDVKKSGLDESFDAKILPTIPPPLGFEHHDNPFDVKNAPRLPDRMEEIRLDHYQENDLKVLDQDHNVIPAAPTPEKIENPPIIEEVVNKFPHEDSNDKIDVFDPIEKVAAAVEELKEAMNDKKEEIDANAIKKEDHEIAIENKEQVVEEIKKLEETKKQLEEEVAEIKKELEEKSQNSQKSVEEKLEAISKKVDDIEAKNKLKENEAAVKTDSVVQLVNGGNYRSPDTEIKSINLEAEKSIQPETQHLADQDIPDSYKIGESISNSKNKSTLAQQIPPIPIILANISNSLQAENKPIIEEVNKPDSNIKPEIKLEETQPNKTVNDKEPVEPLVDKKDDDELIDSIRRDILAVNNQKLLDGITEIVADAKNHQREKRHVKKNDESNNCDAKKIEEHDTKVLNRLLESASNNFVADLHVNLNVIGRNLKSINDDNETKVEK